MVFQNVTMDLTALNNITSPTINISGSSSFSNIVSVANSTTNDLIIFASMFIILVIIYFALSDKSPIQDFGYDDLRALCIALSVSLIIGLEIIEVGWSTNFFAIGMFSSLWLINLIAIMIYENRDDL